MNEVIFLFVLGLIWILFASIQDLQSREVANWVSFSLIIFALGFRFFNSLFSNSNFMFFYQGLIGLGIFFILGMLLYYGRMFAGGDAKLMIALGTILSFSSIFWTNVKIFVFFIILFLFVGMIYSLFWSGFLTITHFKEFKKEFTKQVYSNKKIAHIVMAFGLVLMIFGFKFDFLFLFGILIFIVPYFYFYAKSVDESCMIKKVPVGKLTEGDWLYKNVKVGKSTIKANWDGVSLGDIEKIKKKHDFVLIRQGIPFVPVFLISYIILGIIYFLGYIEDFLVF